MVKTEEIKVDNLRKKITDLSNELKNLNSQQELLHKEKREVEKLITSIINETKQLKTQKKELDAEIKTKKVLRTALNKELASSKKISSKKDQPSPNAILRQIEAMQYAIETEGLPFEKEKAYMDRIKQLKIKLAEIEAHNEKVLNLSEKKQKADTIHKEIQELAKRNTELFSKINSKIEELAKLKIRKKDLQNKIKEIKSKIDQMNLELSDTLNSWLNIAKTTPQKELKTSEEVFDSIKNIKRLTKEDLLKLQRNVFKHGD